MPNFDYKVFTDITQINRADWELCFKNKCFTDYAFLSSLERSGCVNQQTGWQPYHIAIYNQAQLVALLPGYIKNHSYGEYVFDWAWAEAYERYQLDYYPKWICAVPFTPVAGQRLGVKEQSPELIAFIKLTLTELANDNNWSSWHINFCLESELAGLKDSQVLARRGVQFSWHNRGFSNFNDYLNCLTARKRKSIKKERNKALANIDEIKVLQGQELSLETMTQFYHFYCATYLKRSGHQGYLNLDFFVEILNKMREKVVLIGAYKEDLLVAASLFFKNQQSLYGRYWGSIEQFDSVHFELCYYQGIEFCINNKLDYFNAGAQGEHKILRGFEPEYTYSCHYIRNHTFQPAIASFLQQEWQQLAKYKQQCESVLPFNKLQ